MANKVVVFCSPARSRAPLRKLRIAALASLSALKENRSYLEVYLVDAAAIRSLNRRFRKRDKVTNVLSLPAKGGFPEPSLAKGFVRLGEVYLAPGYIKAKGENIYFLLIHGILHLLGYTHEERRDTIRMEKKEKQILKTLAPKP